jgi:hypothetical protein
MRYFLAKSSTSYYTTS